MEWSRFLTVDSIAIFLFHGVIRRQRYTVRNYTRKHLLLDRFVAVVRALREAGTAVSLPELVAATREGKGLPPRAYIVTFDDGFENNCSVAAPVLEDLGIPATFYVTTGFLDTNGCSWTDRLEAAVERTPVVHLRLPYPWAGGPRATAEEKMALLDDVRRTVKNDGRIDPDAFADDICRQLDVGVLPADPELDQKMTWDQVRALAGHPRFTVGGHGHTHRILEYLDDGALARELDVSLDRLRTELGGPIEHYSYPEGLAHCYSDRVIAALHRRGVVCAPTAEEGVNRVGDDLFRLRRIMVVN